MGAAVTTLAVAVARTFYRQRKRFTDGINSIFEPSTNHFRECFDAAVLSHIGS